MHNNQEVQVCKALREAVNKSHNKSNLWVSLVILKPFIERPLQWWISWGITITFLMTSGETYAVRLYPPRCLAGCSSTCLWNTVIFVPLHRGKWMALFCGGQIILRSHCLPYLSSKRWAGMRNTAPKSVALQISWWANILSDWPVMNLLCACFQIAEFPYWKCRPCHRGWRHSFFSFLLNYIWRHMEYNSRWWIKHNAIVN